MTDQIRAESGGDSLDLGHQQERAAGQMCADCGHAESSHDMDGDGDCTVDGCDCDGYIAEADRSGKGPTIKDRRELEIVAWARENGYEPYRAFRSDGSPILELLAVQPQVRYAVAPILDIDVRDPEGNGDGSWTMSGYAAVFDQKTTLYDGKFLKLTEDLAPAAFDRCLREQGLETPAGVVHFNPSHDMSRAVAATDVPVGQIGSLTVRPDARGLFYLARVSREDPDAVAMAAKMRIGVLRQASFAFTIAKAEYTDTESDEGPDESHRRILEVGHLYDVCATPQGAYPQTVSQLRSYAAAIGQLEQELEGRLVSRDFRGENAVIPALGGGVARARLLARAQRERMRFQKAS